MKNRTRFFISILILLVFGFGYYSYFLNSQAKTKEINDYNYSFIELVNNVNNVENYLAKALISKDTKHSSDTLTKIWADSSLAVSYLKNIPFNSSGSNKSINFLNQVSDYCYTLSRKTLKGNELTEDDFSNLKKLYDYSLNLKNILNQISFDLNNESISWEDLKNDKKLNDVEDDTNVFSSIDGNFDDYEGLIYDGAYSNYVSKNEKKGLVGDNISEEEAKNRIKKIFGDDFNVKINGKQNGDIESYNITVYKDKIKFDVQMAVKGGWIVEVDENRSVGEEKIKDDEAIQKGKEYLEKLGYESMKETYFLKESGIVTINYAYEENGVLMYPDLIKVKVALDNGDILGMEALGYLNSHTTRNLSQNIISSSEAKEKLSNNITIENERMAVIPLDDKTEKYCYEFKGRVENKEFLVYINAENGDEEEILILLETPRRNFDDIESRSKANKKIICFTFSFFIKIRYNT